MSSLAWGGTIEALDGGGGQGIGLDHKAGHPGVQVERPKAQGFPLTYRQQEALGDGAAGSRDVPVVPALGVDQLDVPVLQPEAGLARPPGQVSQQLGTWWLGQFGARRHVVQAPGAFTAVGVETNQAEKFSIPFDRHAEEAGDQLSPVGPGVDKQVLHKGLASRRLAPEGSSPQVAVPSHGVAGAGKMVLVHEARRL